MTIIADVLTSLIEIPLRAGLPTENNIYISGLHEMLQQRNMKQRVAFINKIGASTATLGRLWPRRCMLAICRTIRFIEKGDILLTEIADMPIYLAASAACAAMSSPER